MDFATYTVLYWIKPCRYGAIACPVEGKLEIFNTHNKQPQPQTGWTSS